MEKIIVPERVSRLVSALRYIDATYDEGFTLLRHHEKHHGSLVDWIQTERTAALAQNDGWQGVELDFGGYITYDGTWHYTETINEVIL